MDRAGTTDVGERTGPEPAGGSGAPAAQGTRPPVRFARGPSAFEAELGAHVQERLRLVTAFLGIAGTALLLVGRLNDALAHGWGSADHVHPSVLVHAAACVLAGVFWALLRSRRFSGRGLLVMDLLVAELLVAVCLAIFAFSYRTGIRQVVACLGLFLIARAVAVPSRPGRTFWLSVPAPLGILLVQWAHGAVWFEQGVALPASGFTAWVLWDQAVLWLAVAIATAASKVGFALRYRAFEAQQVDRYALEGVIGSGAMGIVYRARHGLLRRPTALKVLRPEIAGPTTLQRFEHEVRQTARLTHPNTIAVYDYGTTADGVFYYAMELLDGADLERIVEATGPLSAARVIHVLAQACGALGEAHGIGLIHRDLKPANIILCRRGGEDDVAKVTDFGLVKDLTASAEPAEETGISGTPLTMAPEMIRGGPLVPATDLYSLGAVGCFLLTGRPVFEATTLLELLAGHLGKEPKPPSALVPGVPADLEAVLLRCLRKDPADRFASAAGLRAALLGCADAGRWSGEDARRWWREHGPRFASRPSSPPAA